MSVTAQIPPLSNYMSAWPFKIFALLLHEVSLFLPGMAFVQAYNKHAYTYTGINIS